MVYSEQEINDQRTTDQEIQIDLPEVTTGTHRFESAVERSRQPMLSYLRFSIKHKAGGMAASKAES